MVNLLLSNSYGLSAVWTRMQNHITQAIYNTLAL